MVLRHHQALAGGTSTFQLQTTPLNGSATPPGFSRWYFNFSASQSLVVSQGLTRLFVAEKLKNHRLKPGGVAAVQGRCC